MSRVSLSTAVARKGVGTVLVLSAGLAWLACSDSGTAEQSTTDGGTSADATVLSGPVNVAQAFLAAGLTAPITTEPCTLSGGTATTCYRISVKGAPSDHAVGPFCPRNISDGADKGGIWPENGVANELSGAFIANLATFYNDSAWNLYDSTTGEIKVTDTQQKCEAAARPNVDPLYNNYCVECSLDYVGGGVKSTYLLPVTPVALPKAAALSRMGKVGVALNGVDFDPPAPVEAILAAHTIAAFDDCGGHVNTAAGYHYHAATGCGTKVESTDGHSALIGFAMDGYGLYAMKDGKGAEATDLDECRGHSDGTRGFHYHVAGAGENMFIGCFHGEQGSRQ